MRRNRSNHTEEGAVLVMVLIAVSVIGLVVGAVITQADASMSSTRVVREQDRKVYAADAGVEDAIRSLQKNSLLCNQAGQSTALPTQSFNGRTVDIGVQCNGVTSTATNLSTYAVIVTDRSTNALLTQGGGNQIIDGPLYAAELDPDVSDMSIAVSGDTFEQQASGGSGRCMTDADQPAGLTSDIGLYHCVSGPVPDPAPSLPTALPNAGTSVLTGSCKVFKPGLYSGSITLAASNYFVSGVYYFVNVSFVLSNNEIIVAGAPSTADVNTNGNTPCNGGGDAGSGAVGTGVKWIFGGTSSIDVEKGQVELFRREGGPASEGSQGVSLMTVGTNASGWTKSSLDVTGSPTNVITVGSGNQPQLAIHGLVYTPSANVDFKVTNDSYAMLTSGIVTGRLKLQASGSALANGTPSITINNGTITRKAVITSTAEGVTDGGRDIVATAVVNITNDVNRTVSIDSWNTT